MTVSNENIDDIDRVIDRAWNRGDTDVIDDVVTDDYVLNDPQIDREVRGPNGFKDIVRMFRGAFPDLEMTVEERIVGEDEVVECFRITGTHQGELMGLEPTGKEVDIRAIVVHRMRDGTVVEDFACTDYLGLMQQIGAVERPSGAGE